MSSNSSIVRQRLAKARTVIGSRSSVWNVFRLLAAMPWIFDRLTTNHEEHLRYKEPLSYGGHFRFNGITVHAIFADPRSIENERERYRFMVRELRLKLGSRKTAHTLQDFFARYPDEVEVVGLLFDNLLEYVVGCRDGVAYAEKRSTPQ